MGDNFLLRQIENFRKRRDLALADMKKPVLFDRPQLVTTVFTAKPLPEEDYESGECLWAFPDSDVGRVALVRAHRRVGYLDGDGAKVLREVLCAPDSPGMTKVRIMGVSGLSGMAKAQVEQW
jgi:hypothetical protein